MELIIKILMLFIIINCILKLSLWKPWQSIVFGLVCVIFILSTSHYATMQSKSQLAYYLKNIKVMQDAAVLITIESAICFTFCFAALQNMYGKKKKRWTQILYWYPGILIFPVLFYILTQLIFNFPGIDFDVISYVLSLAVLIILPTLGYLVRYIYPEKELRLEVYFLVSLFVCIIGLINTVNGNVTYTAVKEPININAIILSISLFGSTFMIGFAWNKIKWIIRQKKELKNKLSQSNK